MTHESHDTNETPALERTIDQTASSESVASPASRPTDPRAERTAEAAGAIVEAAVDIGRTWAGYGLRVGKLALETHAHTMGKLASALGELNRAFEPRPTDTAPSATDGAPPATDTVTTDTPQAA